MLKRIALALCALTCLTLVGCAKVDSNYAIEYAQAFCQTTSDKMWQSNKSYLTKNVSDDVKERLETWFEGSNYSDGLRVSVKSATSTIIEGTGESMILLSCSSDYLSYWVVMTLEYQNNILVDFTYKSIDQMGALI